MALQGTGSAVNGWTRPFYLTARNYPITVSAWVRMPASSTTSSGFFGLTGSNAMAYMLYFGSDIGGPNNFWLDVYDDTGLEGADRPQSVAGFVSDGGWHHIAAQIITPLAPPPGGMGGIFWLDGVRVGDTSLGFGLGAQTLQSLQIGVAPTDGTEPVFATTTALAEICVFANGPTAPQMDQTIAALVQGVNPLRTPGKRMLKAYHPLRSSFQDFGSQRVGFAPLGTPVAPVWVGHPPVDAPLVAFRKLPVTHVAAALAGTSSSVEVGTGPLTTAIVAAGTGSSTDSATGDLLASGLQGYTQVSTDSGIGSLVAATHLTATGASADSGLGAFSGSGIFLQSGALSVSNDAAIGSLTIPSIAANAQQLQNALVDAIMRGQPFQPPPTWFVALVSQLGDTITPGLELSGNGYARASVAASFSAWSATQGPGTTAASTGLSGMVSNNTPIAFPTATGDWLTAVGYEFWDAPSGGNRWISGKLGTSLQVLNGQTRQFAPAALSVAIG